MKKSVWIFLFAVLLPSVVLGWLALRSAEEQQIIFERRTAELYQKETEALAVTVRDTVDAERRVFGETVHRLLAKGDADALARDFTNTLADAWEVKAVGFAINRDGKLVSPSVATASKQPELQRFLLGNGGFLTSTEPAIVYNWAGDNNAFRNNKLEYVKGKSGTNQSTANPYSGVTSVVSTGGIAGKDVGQLNDGAAVSGGTLGMGSRQDAGAGTLVLNGTTQAMNQPQAGASAFDFSGVLRAQNQPGMDDSKRLADAPGGTPMPFLMPKKPVAQQKRERGNLAPAQPAPAPVPQAASAPAALAATSRARTPAAGEKLGVEREEMPASRLNSAEKDASDARTAAKIGTRGLARDEVALKTKAAELATDSEFAKKRAGAIDELKKSDPRPEKAMPAKPTDNDRKPATPTLSPAAPPTARRIELKTAEAMTKPQEAAMPAAAPLPKGSAVPHFSKSKESAASPMAKAPAASAAVAFSGKAEVPQTGSNPDGAFGEQPVMTKSGSGVLSLNSAVNRQVEPQQVLGAQGPALSTVMPEEAEFRSLTEEGDEGMVARFVQDKLNLIFWVRPPEAPEMVFGCLVEAGHFSDVWKEVLERHRTASRGARAAMESKPEFVLALLDDRGKPVATQPADASARDWKHPFVASEIGEALPHWEAALYLASPTALAESARGLWRTLAFTIAGMVALIALGGWLVVADARRQLALAQQKTDFVSNVSHELNTPLTSIRMFAELMHDRPQPAEKQGQYLRIITVEAERLTRLINNVLDFAKIGRKQKRFEKKPLDLHEVVARVWESQELHLREDGFTTRWEAEPGPYPVLGDDDALAQVLVNLISNAEKYSTEKKCVELHTWLDGGWVNVSVLDCGMGVPDGDEKKIFEAFYRAHDSLASGIQGSGLGLTLAQRIAREHEGEIKLEHREGGGCRFTLRLPLAEKHAAENIA